ncbi:MAG: lipoprotein signal peptidase [Flavobacteriales bacterium]|nr:lipoprotein signal peptidase [Flavobacteriales bacterium]
MKRALLLVLLVLAADQALKVWIKLTFYYDASIPLFGEGVNWAYLHFIENRGMAFGLEFGGRMGKLMLTLFRIVAVIGIGYMLVQQARRGASQGLVLSLALVLAGALGNIIDSTFYGMLFSESTHYQKAVLFPPEGGYAALFHGAVVDMFYFPLVDGRLPQWVPYWGGDHILFFRPVFNIADAAITCGIVWLIFAQRHAQPHTSEGSDAMNTAPAVVSENAMPEQADGGPSPEQRTDPQL